jgi:hypothetical protein
LPQSSTTLSQTHRQSITDLIFTYQTDEVLFRYDPSRWQRVESDMIWRYDTKNDIGLELMSVPSPYHDPLYLVDKILDDIHTTDPVIYG